MNLSSTEPVDARLATLLEAAVGVFARFGFRKTSMEEVARAAGVSRQGLYLQFSNKEELFRRALTYTLDSQLKAAIDVLERTDLGLEQRVITACDEWAGRFIGSLGEDAADLMCASTSLAAGTLQHYLSRFEQALEHAIALSPVAAKCAEVATCPGEVARILLATVRGLKHTCTSRPEFVKGVTVAVHMLCALPQASAKGILNG